MVHGVAGRAHAPVISVPEGWDPAARAHGVVTAARPGPGRGARAAARRLRGGPRPRCRLVVLHAWWLASGFDVVVVDDTVRDEWAARSREELQPVLAPLRPSSPTSR